MRKSTAPSRLSQINSSNTSSSNSSTNGLRNTTDLLALLRKAKNEEKNDDAVQIDDKSVEINTSILHRSSEDVQKNTENIKPLECVKISECINNESNTLTETKKQLFNVVWGKPTKKKHKTWEGDGVLEISNKSAVLKDEDGNILGRASNFKNENLIEGGIIYVGMKEVQIIDEINDSEIKTEPIVHKRMLTDSANSIADINLSVHSSKKLKFENKNFVQPLYSVNKGTEEFSSLTMPFPDNNHQWHYNTGKKPVTKVQLDCFLARVLRSHQKNGLIFLYSCIVGLNNLNYTGAILADEMGLGKTLQCVCLIWMLLKSGPYGNVPLFKRVLIVTPSSLVNNWLKEFRKWLNSTRLNAFAINKKQKPSDYVKLPYMKFPVMIISYEMLVNHFTDIENINFDLIVCDEGHRLKNSAIRTAVLLNQLKCKRRILLTGTPIQNNLQEFFALIDFVNPGILGTQNEFKRYFEDPIVQSNQPNCTEEICELGKFRAKELYHRTSFFILRRTQQVISQYLPAKQDIVVFCTPSLLQVEMYKFLVAYWSNKVLEKDTGNHNIHLGIVTALKKICNHPILLSSVIKAQSTNDFEDIAEELKRILSNKLTCLEKTLRCNLWSTKNSGKLAVLSGLLEQLSNTKERIVIVSYFTQTLDMLQRFCTEKLYNFLRLDGSTPVTLRSELIDKFNSPTSEQFIFLLSAKAGGVGLNLIGASRLVLFDLDWNPASDLQAMSRIWRDGQKRNVYIYRLLTTGTIEEKIYQRQILKTHLSNAVVDINNATHSKLSAEELKDLFEFKENVDSITHNLLMCNCDGTGVPQNQSETTDHAVSDTKSLQLDKEVSPANNKTSTLKISELMQWEHFRALHKHHHLEELRLQLSYDVISFLFRNKSTHTDSNL